jgi:type 2 lantibiotic biosynthesis protein LanM
LLALLYAVDATDIHYENLIAAGDQPVLVDVETLFHPTIAPATTAGPDPAREALAASVTRTALLPHLLVGEHGALDVSGLGGDKDTTFPFDAVRWDAGGTDEMRLVRRPVAFRGAVNRPRFDGRDIDPAEYLSALLTGFRAGYDALVAHRSELVGPGGLLERCADDEIRIVVRTTRTYTTLLDESTHPDLLRDGLDRDRLFDVLWTDAVHSTTLGRLVRHESAGLWAGDVPLFAGRPRARDVWTPEGERVPDVLGGTSLDAVTTKIMSMDELDRLDQEWLITAAMATRAGPVDHRGGDPAPALVASAVPDEQRLLTAACGIADQIVARSMQDEQRANWLGLERVSGRHWAIMPMGAGLADGYPGVALFLAQLGRLTGSRRYRELARRALSPVPRLLDAFTADHDLAAFVGPGGFLGMGGICYALSRVSTLLGDHEIASWLPTAIELTGTMGESAPDIAAGYAGGLLAMLAVHAETGLEPAAKVAGILAGELAGNVDLPRDGVFPPVGFAGGPAGVALALRRYAGPGRHAPVPSPTPDAGYGWCSGLSGTLLAHADLLDRSPNVSTCADIDRWVAVLADRRPQRDASLCHGELGIAEALVVLARYGHERAAEVRTQYAARALGALDRYGPQCGTPDGVPCPGLLTGLAGIGYGLLRLGFAEDVPSVLLLEPKILNPGA